MGSGLRGWFDFNDDAMNRLYSELHRNILDVFNEYGVQIMTPAYEGDPPEPKVVSRKDWYTAPAAGPAVISERHSPVGDAGAKAPALRT